MITLQDISFRYDDRTILDRVNVDFEEGELTVVCGRTGSGKSTLLGVLTGLVPRFSGGELSGDVQAAGESILHLPPRERAHLIGFVGQDPLAGFVTDTVEEELAFGMEQLGLPAQTMRRRVEETLDLLGLEQLRRRDLRHLSGGQQQRVAIGSVLTMHPKVVVLDEPTSALDPTAAEEVLATLTRLVHDLGITVILAEHRLERVIPFADQMVVLSGDAHVRSGSPAQLLQDSPVAPPIVELGRLAGWSPLPLTVRDARRQARGWQLPAGPAAGAAEVDPDAKPAVCATRVSTSYGATPVLREVSFSLAPGTVTALMGRNGSGKSTLLWTLQGSRERTSGAVSIGGQDPAALSSQERRRLTGLVPQTAADLLYLETVGDECDSADAGADQAAGTCAALVERLVPGVDPTTHPRDLSEGQRLGLALAVVLTQRPQVLLLDEPTRGLDYPAKAQLSEVVRGLAQQGTCVLLATHDVEFAAHVADRALVLAEGEVVASDTARVVLGQSPAFAPQVTKVLGEPWLTVDEVADALG